MTVSDSPAAPHSPSAASNDLLDSWKEIAAHLRRDVRTVQRWEKSEGLPVHRHQHDKLGSVFAFKSELSAWFSTRRQASAAVDTEVQQPVAAHLRPDGKRIKLVVLPFENLQGTSDEDYFSDGLTEEMITQITRLQPSGLAVIALATAMQYKANQKPLGQIRQELGVDYILQGKVRRSTGRVRITAQLVHLQEQTQIWAETYERDLRDILAVQAEIAQAIAGQIHLAVNPPTRGSHPQDGSRRVSALAYEAYLKGRYHLHGMLPATIKQSIEHFQGAIQQDPNYAPPYACLANAYALLAIAPFDLLPPHQAMPRAEAAAKRSLELDDSLPEAHTALALVRHHYHWDWKGAESSYRRSLELNPTYANAHLWYSWLLLALGRQGEAMNEIDRTLAIVRETDPHRLVAVHATQASAYYFGRHYDLAVKECEKALALNPNYVMLHYILGRAYARMGAHPKAIAHLKLKGSNIGEVPLIDAALGLAEAISGKKDQTEKIIEALKSLAGGKRYIPSTYFGMLYAGLGDMDQALVWLEKAYEEHAAGLTWVNVDPMLDELRSNPRFQDLVRRIGLT